MIAYYLKKGDAVYDVDTFQQYDDKLAERLLEVLLSEKSNCLVCMPYVFKNFSMYKCYERFHYEREYDYYENLWRYVYARRKQVGFGDSCFTRFQICK